MACKMMVAAAAAASVLVLSFLFLSGADGLQIGAPGCTIHPSRVPDCEFCKDRCQLEGGVSGLCDGNKRCMCISCSSSGAWPPRLK
ncbi:hypothetical protein PVAP13_7NG056100 [Panicum virgatum]|uniref:Uncharacterized protein n=1 Tax=Panicum virgatum TaxID=38727 RepID=A0A8T0PVF6_PANVG|nr:hypothetical protein PVAP13_7NG056100 [Panicum virgatum]